MPQLRGQDWLSGAIRAVAVQRSLRSGEVLFRSGTRTVGLFEVVKGKLRLVRVDRSGREAILQVAVPGDTLAEASLFSPTYNCDAIATTDAVARLYPKTALLAQLVSK